MGLASVESLGLSRLGSATARILLPVSEFRVTLFRAAVFSKRGCP